MFSSIQCGARKVETERFFVSLADMPLIPAAVYRELAELPGFSRSSGAARPYFRGSKGHPVLLARTVIDKILQFNKSHTMREVLEGLPLVRLVTECSGVVRDIDDPEDYRELTRHK
jgi:molybdenum cofactor cytidylyltransferase